MAEDPSGTAPQVIDSTSNSNDGTSAGSMTSGDLVDGEIGKAQSMLEITAWDRDPNGPYKANVIGDLVRDKLSGWRGNWCDTYVDGCTLEGEPIDRDEIPNDGSSDGWHAVDQTYQVTHSSPVPTLS
jgi:hypothetical protein